MTQTALAQRVGQTELTWTTVLRCPISGRPLREMGGDELEKLNWQIHEGAVCHQDGSSVKHEMRAGLRAVDTPYVYRIEHGIIVLLKSLAIVPFEVARRCDERVLRQEKCAVQRFYDELGWTRSADGVFVDAKEWEDLRPVSRDYIYRCHGRVKQHLRPTGRFLLDVASGPIQYDEYLTYSAGFEFRICVDISFAALRAAQARLGAHGIYLLGDITNLPLKDNAVDGAVSLHTIYHVPADEQAIAFREIFRVLQPETTAVVVYIWRSSLVKLMELPVAIARTPQKLFRKLFHALRCANRQTEPNERQLSISASQPTLYFHAHRYSWFVQQSWPFDYVVRVWRSISVRIQRAYFHRWLGGQYLLKLLYCLEELMPHVCGRFGAYPLIVIRKKSLPPQ